MMRSNNVKEDLAESVLFGADKKASKFSKAKLIASTLVVAVSVSAAIAGCNKTALEQKYNVLNADGTTIELTADELKTALSGDVFFQGVKIDGVDVSGKTKEEAIQLLSSQLKDKPSEVNIKLDLDGEELPLDISSLKLENNASEIVDEAFSYARPAEGASGEELVDCYSKMQTLKTTPVEYNTAFTVNTDGLSDVVHGILDPYQKEKVEPTIESFDTEKLEFVITDSQVGCKVDIEKAITDTKALLDAGTYEGTVTVDCTKDEPEASAEELRESMGLISSSSSTTTSDSNRNANIDTACKKLDGHVIQPGETFSFNGYVGPRTSAAGYKSAGIILDGKAAKGLGGGVCQVSSMLFQSACKADLEINERHPHEWPSTYCPIGTDATVDYGSADMRFTNTSEYPIAIHAFYVDEKTEITIQLYGHKFDDGVYIELVSSGGPTGEDAGVVYEADPEFDVGTVLHSHPAHPAQSAVCYKVWYDKDGNEIKRDRCCGSYYPSIPEYVAIGVLREDGTIAEMDPETGEIIDPEATEETTDPSATPSVTPSVSPSVTPSSTPSATPSVSVTPTPEVTSAPTSSPTNTPTEAPTETPTETPTEAPTEAPTSAPEAPTQAPEGGEGGSTEP